MSSFFGSPAEPPPEEPPRGVRGDFPALEEDLGEAVKRERMFVEAGEAWAGRKEEEEGEGVEDTVEEGEEAEDHERTMMRNA